MRLTNEWLVIAALVCAPVFAASSAPGGPKADSVPSGDRPTYPANEGRTSCDKPVYLTLDTGHMGVAPLVADVLKRQQVQVTFFLANEKTQARMMHMLQTGKPLRN